MFLLAATWCLSLLTKPGSAAPVPSAAASAVTDADVSVLDEPAGAHHCCDSIANLDASAVNSVVASLGDAIRWSAPVALPLGVAGLVLAAADPRRTRGHLQVWRH